jgi:hypothetical protein
MKDSIRASRQCKGLLKLCKSSDKLAAVNKYKHVAAIYTHVLKLPECPHRHAHLQQWEKWAVHVGLALKELRKSLHHTRCQEKKAKKGEHNKKIEKARLVSSDSGIFYKYITNSSFTPPATELLVEGEWIATPKLLMKFEDKNLVKHMYGRGCTYHSEKGRTNPFCEPNKRGKELRKQVANGSGNEWKSFVPKEAHEFFEKGRVVLAQEHLSDYDGIFDTEIPFQTFDKFCFAKAKDRAPSVSNVRIDHVCSAQIRERKLICKILSLPYLTGKTFRSWDHEIINWIPKEPGNPAIDRRRPIALLEVLRKVT